MIYSNIRRRTTFVSATKSPAGLGQTDDFEMHPPFPIEPMAEALFSIPGQSWRAASSARAPRHRRLPLPDLFPATLNRVTAQRADRKRRLFAGIIPAPCPHTSRRGRKSSATERFDPEDGLKIERESYENIPPTQNIPRRGDRARDARASFTRMRDARFRARATLHPPRRGLTSRG